MEAKLINYRQDRITKRIYRRAGNGPEEFNPQSMKWEVTADAVEAFYDSSDTTRITELEALSCIERQKEILVNR